MDSYEEISLIDEEMERMIDSAIDHAEDMAIESAQQFSVLDENIGEVIEDSERSMKKTKFGEIGMSLIFVSPEAIEHLKYIQNLRGFLKEEASRLVANIMAKREKEKGKPKGKGKGKAKGKGKKYSRKN